MSTEADYTIKHPKQIVSKLKQLVKRNCLLSAHFGDKNESFITTILDIEPEKNMVYLDYGPTESLNKSLLIADSFEFRTELDGIKVSFTGLKINRIKRNGQPVFSLTMPDALVWFERRMLHRVKVPLYHESFLQIPFAIRKDGEEETQTIDFKLLDLSISGAAFLNMQAKLSRQFIPTTVFENCQLIFHDKTLNNIKITIRNKSFVDNDKKEKGQRIGCQFESISVGYESAIQRYMQAIERELANIRS
jgi:c-di-GMP-binding flagellar brake protein YcgR